jgi:hypothetical protein
MKQKGAPKKSGTLIAILVALLALPILWLIKSYFSIEQRLLEVAVAGSLLYGLGVVVFLLVPLIFKGR